MTTDYGGVFKRGASLLCCGWTGPISQGCTRLSKDPSPRAAPHGDLTGDGEPDADDEDPRGPSPEDNTRMSLGVSRLHDGSTEP